ALTGRLHRLSGGVPRVLNVLCDRALLGAYAQSKDRIDRGILAQAAREVFGRPMKKRRNSLVALSVSLSLLAGAALAVVVYKQERGSGYGTQNESTPVSPAVASTPAQEEAKPQPPEPPLPETLASITVEPHSRSKTIAYTALFRAWGLDYRSADPCQQAERMGLRCRAARGGLDELRRLNRPAVLQMLDEQGREFFACLTALDEKGATFTISTEQRRVGLAALASQWSGHYTMLWRTRPDLPRSIHPGDSGPSVTWLNQQLAQLQGRDGETSPNAVYDASMVREVKQFQLARGLIPDGTVGAQTLMYLSSAADRSAPVLTPVAGEK
ncbi:MAG TPA: peptidoglycan-binding protein, partial [Burkholderiales bacterium]|nr:peptidoglycan-binding protein [Burkholderiales bacterium]